MAGGVANLQQLHVSTSALKSAKTDAQQRPIAPKGKTGRGELNRGTVRFAESSCERSDKADSEAEAYQQRTPKNWTVDSR